MSMAVNGGSAAGTAGSFNHVSGVQGKDKSIQKWKKVGESKKSRKFQISWFALQNPEWRQLFWFGQRLSWEV